MAKKKECLAMLLAGGQGSTQYTQPKTQADKASTEKDVFFLFYCLMTLFL